MMLLVKVLEKDAWIRNNCVLSDDGTGLTIDCYGLLIISRIPVQQGTFYTLPTNMDRDVLCVEIMSNGMPLLLATVHLESLSFRQYREAQLRIIHQILMGAKPNTDIVLCGDFNFDSTRCG